ncbi:hypothetical protein LTR85_011404 [Meristemomyces frigidus]|nr:hypothetical protein LTR85_011404 [Meristemomyces frigidus]
MSGSSRSTSPDPLTLPSSPLATRSTRYSSVKPLMQRSSNVAYSSPSKSFVMDTGKAGGVSPWRIKVTVEAEPREGSGSPSKKAARTRRVSLKGMESSTPIKKSGARQTVTVEAEDGGEVLRPQRKRKGTPIRRKARTQPAHVDATTEEDDAVLMPPPSSVSRPSSGRSARRKSLNLMPTQRSKRLSQAREELDQALHDAVGSDEDEGQDGEDIECEAAGDMTSMNEDFTMVSVETLQSMKADTSMMSTRHEGDKSGLSVSYLPSSPPQTQAEKAPLAYPNLSSEARRAKTSPAHAYDAMSWKPTQAPKTASSPAQHSVTEQRLDSEPSEWRRHREVVSREINEASTGRVIVIDETEQPSGSEDEDEEEAEEGQHDADIWQEEASRSFEDEVDLQPDIKPATASSKPGDLFANQALKPPRAKIPRTWRRSSGAGFSYADSPAHVEALQVRKRSGGSTDGGSRASSGVLTPPSTDDEMHRLREEGDEEESSDISLTQPDAAATQLQNEQSVGAQEAGPSTVRDEVASPSSDSGSSMASPDGDDTGLFWQSNMPQVYQRKTQRPRVQRLRAMDLSELLGLGKSSPVKNSEEDTGGRNAVPSAIRPLRHSPLKMRAVEGKIKSSSMADEAGKTKLMSSPLRKSLLRSSKMPSSPLTGSVRAGPAPSRQQHHHGPAEGDEDAGLGIGKEESTVQESFASKASDQRQLLTEMAVAQTAPQHTASTSMRRQTVSSEASQHDHSSRDEEPEDYEHDYDSQSEEEYDEYDEQPSRSYEEHLNVESPQKIRVRFNDSSMGDFSLLAPKREYAPLFPSNRSRQQSATQPRSHASPPTVTLVGKRASAVSSTGAQAGIFSRLTTNFWSAVVRPTGPSEIIALPKATAEPTYPPTLRAHIRSRYGVLSASHPWTMAHMRTLHRMLNSCTSGKSDSIIPKTGPLPSSIGLLVGREQVSLTGYKYVLDTQHAQVVDAFMQVLVPAHVVEAMKAGEVEMLGDATAISYRGRLVDGRHGDDLVWGPSLGVRKAGAEIGVEFVAKALGDVVLSNVETAARERRAAEERKRLAATQEGEDFDDLDDDGEYAHDVDDGEQGEMDGSEVMHNVRRSL